MKSILYRIGMLFSWMIIFNYYLLSKWFDFNFYIYIFMMLFIVFMGSMIMLNVDKTFPKKIIRVDKGSQLLILFTYSLYLEIIITGIYIFTQDVLDWNILLTHFIGVLILGNIIFWSGMIRVYIYSVQLGFKWRILGFLCGWIPFINLIVLFKIIKLTRNEVKFEKENYLTNTSRAHDAVCQTKYPIILIHGVFFRDSNLFNYWGRIPEQLKQNGATVFYGEHESASSIEESGLEIAKRIKVIVNETGCEKVNIIAHSKGGLDCRYALSNTEAKDYVASLTTVNTPHNGCLFADYLLEKISPKIQNFIANKYNAAATRLGDKKPDFMKAVIGLTSKSCEQFNQHVLDMSTVFYQSIGSKMNHASSGRFPLNIMYPLVKHFDGQNDGLVAANSMEWGDEFKFVTTPKGRGISHADIIDLNRENISHFNVREFYVEIVHDLKLRGF